MGVALSRYQVIRGMNCTVKFKFSDIYKLLPMNFHGLIHIFIAGVTHNMILLF